jgi:hypothetical protein
MSDQPYPIIPFGKLKGQSVDVLAQDPKYAQWLMAQPWFQQQHPQIYTLIVNNYHIGPTETPEHNKMQVKYLNGEYCLKYAMMVSNGKLFTFNNEHYNKSIAGIIAKLKEERDVVSSNNLGRFRKDPKNYPFFDGAVITENDIIKDGEKQFNTIRDNIVARLTTINGHRLYQCSQPKFEVKGVDVSFTVRYGYGHALRSAMRDLYRHSETIEKAFQSLQGCEYLIHPMIELKPTIGDDFPAVLREMKAHNTTTLVVGTYRGVGATREEFVKYFKTENIQVIDESTIDEYKMPESINIETITNGTLEYAIVP